MSHFCFWVVVLLIIILSVLFLVCSIILSLLFLCHYKYFTPWEFFTSALPDGLSLESEWQQVTSSFQDSSQYSGWSQQCYSLDCLHLSYNFQVLQSLYQSFGYCTKSTNYSWYNHHFHVPQFFQFPSKVQVRILLFTFFQFYSVASRDSKIHNFAGSLFFFVDYHKVWSSGRD